MPTTPQVVKVNGNHYVVRTSGNKTTISPLRVKFQSLSRAIRPKVKAVSNSARRTASAAKKRVVRTAMYKKLSGLARRYALKTRRTR